jgi:hypothetical protein
MSGSRWVKWAAVAVVAAVLISLGVSAFALTADDEPDQADLAAAHQVEARLARLDSLTSGTWAQHSAGAYLDYVANTAEVEPCMAAEGEEFGYPFIDPYAGRPEYTGAGSTWSDPLMSTFSSTSALASARSAWQTDRMGDGNPDTNWEDKSRSYQKAYGKCRHLRENHPGHPKVHQNLSSDLHWLVVDVEERFGDSGEYDLCMLDAGHDIYFDDHGGPDAMHEMLEAAAPDLGLPPAQLVRTDEWADYLALEHDLLKADRDCRIDNFVKVMAALEAPLAEFEQENADEIAELQKEWQVIEAEARELGWTPAPAVS